eukprot:1798027-Rhodomonas_salina.1
MNDAVPVSTSPAEGATGEWPNKQSEYPSGGARLSGEKRQGASGEKRQLSLIHISEPTRPRLI